MDEQSKSLWQRVCATVNKLGGPRSPRVTVVIPPDPSSVLDLHGLGIHSAFKRTKQFINRPDAPLVLTIITGKSGRMVYELPDWMMQFPRVRSWTLINGGGAYEIRLKKPE